MRYSLPDPSDYCPGCGRIRCSCPPPGWEEAQYEAAYERGYEDGLEFGPDDGPANRPDPAWLRAWHNPHREPDPESYLAGFDDAVAGTPSVVALQYERTAKPYAMPTEDDQDDDDQDLPF